MNRSDHQNFERTTKKIDMLEHTAEKLARALGSVSSLILHSFFFIGIFSLAFFGFTFDQILLILTTVVSLEAIYFSIFIQMTVNRHDKKLIEVHEDIEDIQEDVEGIEEDVDDIQKDVEEISEDVEGIQKDVEEISEDVEEISEDLDNEDTKDIDTQKTTDQKLEQIESTLHSLLKEIKEVRERR